MMCTLLVALLCTTDCDYLQPPQAPSDLSRQILDDSQPAEKRRELAEQSADQAAAVIAAMVADLPAGDEQEEYRRIPWIWRVAIAAGKRDQDAPLRALLSASLPKEGQKLRDWQAVVIGGGIINGISLGGKWPQPRMDELLGNDEALRRRWQQTIGAARVMADDAKVNTGTRYDALRMVALDPTEQHLEQLAGYLSKETDEELQMGAVSGLADVDLPQATRLLAESLPGLAAGNRALAIDGLLRGDARLSVLLELLESGKLSAKALSESQRQKLRDLAAGKLRDRAAAVLKNVE
jgi:hypothetical protein